MGVYIAPTDALIKLMEANIQSNSSVNTQSNSSVKSRRRRDVVAGSQSSATFNGVLNPTTCLLHNSVMMWVVSNDNYPEYDRENLFNNNPSFDYGPFQELKEKQQLKSTNSTLFSFRFSEPGVYVFRSSANHVRKMVSKVLPVCMACVRLFSVLCVVGSPSTQYFIIPVSCHCGSTFVTIAVCLQFIILCYSTSGLWLKVRGALRTDLFSPRPPGQSSKMPSPSLRTS